MFGLYVPRIRWWFILFVTVFCLWLFLQIASITRLTNTTEIHFLDVGQGDAILIKSPEGYYGLIDGGRSTFILEELRQVMPVKNFEFIMATHPDADHIEGLLSVLQSYQVNNFFWQKHKKNSPIYTELKKLIEVENIVDYQLHSRNDFSLGCCVHFDVLWPEQETNVYKIEDANDVSYGLLLQVADQKFWLGGDLHSSIEDRLIPEIPKNIYVHKAGHHGSSTSTSDRFSAHLSPLYSIVSVGKDNSYGHPHRQVLQNLTSVGAKILRTDQHGRISFYHNQGKWEVYTEKGLWALQNSSKIGQ